MISEMFVCFCVVRSFEEEDFLENSRPVLFGLSKKRSFEPFECFWIFFFSERRQFVYVLNRT